MTTDEMFQLLLNEVKELRSDVKKLEIGQAELRSDVNKLEVKIDNVQKRLEAGQAELRSDVNKLEAKIDNVQNKLEAKIDNVQKRLEAGQAELRSDVNKLEAKIDNVQNTQDNMRFGIKNLSAIVEEFRAETNQRFNRLEGEFKAYRRSTQATISDIQIRQENTEEDVKQLKDRLDKAS